MHVRPCRILRPEPGLRTCLAIQIWGKALTEVVSARGRSHPIPQEGCTRSRSANPPARPRVSDLRHPFDARTRLPGFLQVLVPPTYSVQRRGTMRSPWRPPGPSLRAMHTNKRILNAARRRPRGARRTSCPRLIGRAVGVRHPHSQAPQEPRS